MVRIGRAGEPARRAAPHPLRRERRGRRVQPRHLRLPADGVPRAHRVVHRPHVGGALRHAERRRDPPARRGRRRRRPLPVEQHDPGVGHRARRRPAGRRGEGRPRGRRLVVGRFGVAAGSRPARRCCSPSCATVRRRGTARMALEMATLGGAGCLGREGELGVLAAGRRRRRRGVAAGRARRSPARSPTRSRRGSAAARWRPATRSSTGVTSSATACSSASVWRRCWPPTSGWPTHPTAVTLVLVCASVTLCDDRVSRQNDRVNRIRAASAASCSCSSARAGRGSGCTEAGTAASSDDPRCRRSGSATDLGDVDTIPAELSPTMPTM